VAVASAGHMQICILPQTDNLASTPPLSFLQACTLTATLPTAKGTKDFEITITTNFYLCNKGFVGLVIELMLKCEPAVLILL